MKNILYPIAGALILASFLLFLFQSGDPISPGTAQHITETKKLKEKIVKAETIAFKLFDSLLRQNTRLSAQLKETQTELKKVNQKNTALQHSFHALLGSAGALSGKAGFSLCESLIKTGKELLQTSVVKDSLYETVTQNLEIQLVNKDSMLLVKEQLYIKLKDSFNQSADNQQQLVVSNSQLQKQNKREKRKNKLLTATLLLLSGAITYNIVHH
jgi:hypothetical protein